MDGISGPFKCVSFSGLLSGQGGVVLDKMLIVVCVDGGSAVGGVLGMDGIPILGRLLTS